MSNISEGGLGFFGEPPEEIQSAFEASMPDKSVTIYPQQLFSTLERNQNSLIRRYHSIAYGEKGIYFPIGDAAEFKRVGFSWELDIVQIAGESILPAWIVTFEDRAANRLLMLLDPGDQMNLEYTDGELDGVYVTDIADTNESLWGVSLQVPKTESDPEVETPRYKFKYSADKKKLVIERLDFDGNKHKYEVDPTIPAELIYRMLAGSITRDPVKVSLNADKSWRNANIPKMFGFKEIPLEEPNQEVL